MKEEKFRVIDISFMLEKFPYCGYVEIWNPSPEDLTDLIPFLEQNRKVALVWVFGEVKHIPNYSAVCHERILSPIYLGKTRREAYDFYLGIRNDFFDRLERLNG